MHSDGDMPQVRRQGLLDDLHEDAADVVLEPQVEDAVQESAVLLAP